MSSYKEILKSTSIIGGSKIISILFRIVKNKIIAILLGPTGIGLIGALKSVIDIVEKFSSLGLNQSAVRNIAQAVGQHDEVQITKTILTLRKAVFITGLLGLILTLLFSEKLSIITFGNLEYVFEIRLLSILVFFNIIKAGQSSLLQGVRKIKSLAKMTIWSSFLSTLLSIPILYYYREEGIAFFLLLLSLSQLVVATHYSREVKIAKIKINFSEFIDNVKDMLKLGLSFMGGALVSKIGGYLIRVFVIRSLGIGVLGLYQAAMSISTIYIGMLLDAISKDFYPRLSAVAGNSKKEISLINEQTEIGMYLSAPGLLFTMGFAPYAIEIMYSSEFKEAYYILQWMILGVFIRTIAWPIGYLFISRGQSNKFFFIQLVGNVIHVCLIFFLTKQFGLTGTGIAFFLMYLIHVCYLWVLARLENGFYWSNTVIKYILIYSIIFSLSFTILVNTSQHVGAIVIFFISFGTVLHSSNKIMQALNIDTVNALLKMIWQKVKTKK